MATASKSGYEPKNASVPIVAGQETVLDIELSSVTEGGGA